jgi:hypothetical protein
LNQRPHPLSGIEGSALCGPAFPQVAGERQGQRDAFLPVGAGNWVHVSRPAHTHGSAHRADLLARSPQAAPRQLARRVRVAVPAPRRGAGGGRRHGRCTRPAPTSRSRHGSKRAGVHEVASSMPRRGAVVGDDARTLVRWSGRTGNGKPATGAIPHHQREPIQGPPLPNGPAGARAVQQALLDLLELSVSTLGAGRSGRSYAIRVSSPGTDACLMNGGATARVQPWAEAHLVAGR